MHAHPLVLGVLASTAAAAGIQPNLLQPRQTGGLDCMTPVSSIVSSAPTAPPQLINWALENPDTITDPCKTRAYPASLTAIASSFQSQYSSWYAAHSADLNSALDKCPPEYRSMYTNFDGGFCKTAVGGGSGNGGAEGAQATGGADKPNAGRRETVVVGGVVAAAGVIGAVVAL